MNLAVKGLPRRVLWLFGGLVVLLVAAGCSFGARESEPSAAASRSPAATGTATPSKPGESVAASPSGSTASSGDSQGAEESVPYAVTGRVLINGQPVVSAQVSLHAASPEGAAQLPPLAVTATDAAGGFALQARAAVLDNLYLLTGGGLTQLRPGELSPQVVLGTLLGRARPAQVVVNELTTVAGAFAASEYFAGESLAGPGDVLAASAVTAAGVVDPVTGVPGAAATADQGQLLMLNTLGNALTSCAWNEPRCAAIVAPVGREPATTTWSGMAATARDPWQVGPIFAIQQGFTAFSPTLQEPPTGGWILLP